MFCSIAVLMWADVLAIYAMWVMMTYLTDVWEIGFTHAAAIINFFWGIVFIMPLAIQYLVDTIIGNYWMLLLSSFAYSVVSFFLLMLTAYYINPLLASFMSILVHWDSLEACSHSNNDPFCPFSKRFVFSIFF